MKINITPEEFASIIMIYLLDRINNEEELIPDEEEFNKLMNNLERVKSYLVKFYLNSDVNNRIYYKRLRSVLEKDGLAETFTIKINKKSSTNESENINKIEKDTKINEVEVKSLVKDVIKKIRKRKFKKSTYMSEEELDNIIRKTINEKGEE